MNEKDADATTQASEGDFLSCLLGSEPVQPSVPAKKLFLSCLLGSELGVIRFQETVSFLSCLLGSEQ